MQMKYLANEHVGAGILNAETTNPPKPLHCNPQLDPIIACVS